MASDFNPENYFFNLRLHVHSITFRTEIDSLKEYIFDSVKNIHQIQFELGEKIESLVEENPEDFGDIHEDNYDRFKQYEDFYPKFFFNSMLISIYSLFENQLKLICNIVHEHKHLDLSVDDLDGRNYIQKSKNFLKLLAKIPVERHDKVWKEIEKYQQIRNLIVHHNSCIKKKSGTIKEQSNYQIVKQSEYIDLNERDGTFKINHHDYLVKLADLIFEYIMSIIEELKVYKN